ncbi:amidohydrolase family protein, partial [Acinetobacter baumannii]|uniref:amidohydrolase family protein n=1 Tax=Acinetobacter baumannii TaxID=470 RepID=UPI0024B778B9
ALVKSLFPEQAVYLDVYQHYGLTGKRSVFAHCVHLEDGERQCMQDAQSDIEFRQTPNRFLGSGLFPLKKAWEKDVEVGLGTEIG